MKRLLFTLTTALGALIAQAQPHTAMKYTTQNNTEFAATIASPTVQLIDVRTPSEYAEGHIPKATNMDVQSSDFSKQAATLDKTRPVALYCRSGARSKRAATMLSSMGYTVYELKNGIIGWNGPTTR